MAIFYLRRRVQRISGHLTWNNHFMKKVKFCFLVNNGNCSNSYYNHFRINSFCVVGKFEEFRQDSKIGSRFFILVISGEKQIFCTFYFSCQIAKEKFYISFHNIIIFNYLASASNLNNHNHFLWKIALYLLRI